MALKGTLKDFGIADILQLIGQQMKTGTLHLKSKEQTVNVAFMEGTIVRADSITRKQKDEIGTMLLRAELITEVQLQAALDTQEKTLQRLGDVLISAKAITSEKFREMVQLQTTETLYKLFTWKSGNYEFVQEDVEPEAALVPLRADAVLMDGFRIVDEWPLIKQKIPNYQTTFEKLNELPPAPPKSTSFDAALDSALEVDAPKQKTAPSPIGDNERAVYALAVAGRTVREIIDRTCLGEFEACKALTTLVNHDYLIGVPGFGPSMDGERDDTFLERSLGALLRIAAVVAIAAALAVGATKFDVGALRLATSAATTYTDPAAQRFISRQQITRIEGALDVYRLEKGQLPEKLEALVDEGLLKRDDLHYPWRDGYFYRRTEDGRFLLLPPLR
jgi:hypothetical protein